MPKRTDEDAEIEPCEHMKDYVSALSDGSLRGPIRWYTLLHASYCRKCGPALRLLRALRQRMRGLRHSVADKPAPPDALTEARRQQAQDALDAIDTSPRP